MIRPRYGIVQACTKILIFDFTELSSELLFLLVPCDVKGSLQNSQLPALVDTCQLSARRVFVRIYETTNVECTMNRQFKIGGAQLSFDIKVLCIYRSWVSGILATRVTRQRDPFGHRLYTFVIHKEKRDRRRGWSCHQSCDVVSCCACRTSIVRRTIGGPSSFASFFSKSDARKSVVAKHAAWRNLGGYGPKAAMDPFCDRFPAFEGDPLQIIQ